MPNQVDGGGAGRSVPYEVPRDADCIIDTADRTVEACVEEEHDQA
jgi:adenylylsulfate kinase-like enzyme